MLTSVFLRRILATAMVAGLAHTVAHAQSAPVADTLAEARRLRDAKDFSGAASLLRPYVEGHPDDAGSARFAALMAYWAHDRVSADSIYAHALALHSGDAAVRLEYARFLLETGSTSRSRAMLAPILAADSTSFTPEQVARARTLLGTARYWSGDFTGARREFATALRLDTSVTDARRQLTEIETSAAPWIRLGTGGWDDDQPLRHATFDIEGGWFANPLTPIVVRSGSTLFDRGDASSETVSFAEAGLSTYAPAAHLDMAITGGMLQRSFDDATDWTARIALGARLPRSVALQVTVERAPYMYTVQSLSQSVMTRSLEGTVRWGTPRGWSGEVLAKRERYPDDNSVATGYVWILAPLLRGEIATLHGGYSFVAQSADENRFSPRGDINVPLGQLPVIVPGEYNPYYTPTNLRAHSALVSASVHPRGRWTFRADGRYALAARDDAPMLVVMAAPPNVAVTRTFYDRSFTPWNVGGAIDCAVTESLRVRLAAAHGREAYYSFSTARVGLTYAFIAAARRRAHVP